MAELVKVNYDAIELAYSLAVFDCRDDYTRAVAYEEGVEDEPLRRAMEYWGDCGERVFRGFLLLHEGVMILREDQANSDGNENQENINKGSNWELEKKRKELTNGHKTEPAGEFELRGILRTSCQQEQSEKDKNNYRKHINERKAKEYHGKRNCSYSTGCNQPDRNVSVHGGVGAPLCDPESDLTATEDESDSSRLRPRRLNIQFKKELVDFSDVSDLEYPMVFVSKSRLQRAKSKFKEVDKLLTDVGRGDSNSKEVDFYRLSMACKILNYIDNPTLGINDCKRLVSQLNSLSFVQSMLTRALETPRGWKARLTKRLHGKKWRRVLSLVHFTNYMTWKWLMLASGQAGSGQVMGIPAIDTTLGPIHPIDEWSVRDECQTCVEFVGKIPHACTLAVNSKDQLVMMDSRNYVTVYTVEGKPLLAFKASTSRHPHARWIIGVDADDNIYIGSALGILSKTKRPLSIFTDTGKLLSEPELRGCRGRFHLYTVTKSGVILTLSVGTQMGNVVTLHQRDSKLINLSFIVREIALPRVFSASNENIIIGGTTANESKDFAFQVFDHLGQQLYFFKPEVNFQHCEVDPWTGSLVLVKTATLRDYRHCLCNTVVLTGEVRFLATNGQTIKSSVNLRWPFRKVVGATVLRCGLVAVVTMDEPYYAIHVI